MKFEEYLDSLRNKSVAVIGIGVSNRPLIRLLLERGIRVTACDKKSRGTGQARLSGVFAQKKSFVLFLRR